MPTREVPYFVHEIHEVNSENYQDWTVSNAGGDWEKELRLRYIRNLMIKEQLLEGRTAAWRQSGRSLEPRVMHNHVTHFKPVERPEEVKVNDIVFCEVQYGNRFYAHVVKHKYWYHPTSQWCFTISNIQGKENGWCYMEHVYGLLVKTHA